VSSCGRWIAKAYDGVTVVKYLYDGDHCIAEYDGEDQLLRRYIYGATRSSSTSTASTARSPPPIPTIPTPSSSPAAASTPTPDSTTTAPATIKREQICQQLKMIGWNGWIFGCARFFSGARAFLCLQ